MVLTVERALLGCRSAMRRMTPGLVFGMLLACEIARAPQAPRPPVNSASAPGSPGSAATHAVGPRAVDGPDRAGPAEREYQKGVSALQTGKPGDAQVHFDRAIGILEQETGERLSFAVIRPRRRFAEVEWAQNGARVAVSDPSGLSVYTRRGRELVRFDIARGLAKVAISPDGAALAVQPVSSTNFGQPVRVYDVDSGKLAGRSFIGDGVTALAVSPGGRSLAICRSGPHCGCSLVDVKSGEGTPFIGCTGNSPGSHVEEAQFSPDGEWLALARSSGIEIRDTKTFTTRPGLKLLDGKRIGFEDAKTLSVESEAGGRKRYDVIDQQLLGETLPPSRITPRGGRYRAGRLLPETDVAWNGKVGVTRSDERLQVWLSTGSLGRSWPDEGAQDFALAPDGRTLAVLGLDPLGLGAKLLFVDVAGGEQHPLLVSLPVTAVALAPPAVGFQTADDRAHVIRGSELVVLGKSSAGSGRFFLTDRGDRLVQSGGGIRTWRRGDTTFSAGPESGELASAGSYFDADQHEGKLVLTKLAADQSVTFREPDSVSLAALSRDERLLAVGTFQCAVDLFDTRSGQLLARLPGAASDASAVACAAQQLDFSPSGKRLLSIQHNGGTVLYDVVARRTLWRAPDPHAFGVATDWGAVLVDLDSVTTMWRAGQSKPDWTSAPPEYAVTSLSGSGSWIAIGSFDGVEVVEVAADRKLSKSVAKIYAPRDLAATVVTSSSGVEFIGPDADQARALVTCRFGAVSYPFALCASRFIRKGLLASTSSTATR